MGLAGGILAYILFHWTGVAFYILSISGFAIVIALFWLKIFIAAVIKYVRVSIIPSRRCVKVAEAHNRSSSQKVTVLSVMQVRFSDIGTIGRRDGSLPDGTEIDLGGHSIDDITPLLDDFLYVVISPDEVELWQRSGTSYLAAVTFERHRIRQIRRVDDSSDRLAVWALAPKDVPEFFGARVLELRFDNDAYIRLLIGYIGS
jgi:hypothetical protein